MHCSPSAEARPRVTPAPVWLQSAALLILMALGAALYAAADPGFKVRSASTRLVDGVQLVDARIDFDFSDEAMEAMENGVAITVSLQMQVLELKRLWDDQVAEVSARYRIQAHALSRQYLVKNLSTGEVSTYRDFGEMREAIGRLQDFPLLDDHVLDDGEQYRVRLRAALEIESLPTPLRLLAWFKPAWRLSSDWFTWALAR